MHPAWLVFWAVTMVTAVTGCGSAILEVPDVPGTSSTRCPSLKKQKLGSLFRVCEFPGRRDLLLHYRTRTPLRWSPDAFPLLVMFTRGIPVQVREEITQSLWTWNRMVGGRVFQEVPVLPWYEDLPYEPQRRLRYRSVLVFRTQLGMSDPRTYRHGEAMVQPIRAWSPYLNSGVIGLDSEIMSPEHVRVVMVHEFGHILGLGHDSSIRSIMFTNAIGSWANIENRDIDYVRFQMGFGGRTLVIPWNTMGPGRPNRR